MDLQSSTIMDEQCNPSTPVMNTGTSTFRSTQKENFPPKNATKLSKVSFQTPARDPVTRKVLSPQLTNVLSPKVGENEQSLWNTEAPGRLEDKWHKDSRRSSEMSNLEFEVRLKQVTETNRSANEVGPGNEEQGSSHGAYTLDLDMLDVMNPFTSNSKVMNSPDQSDNELDSREQCLKIIPVNNQVLAKKTEKRSITPPYNMNTDRRMIISNDILLQVENQNNDMDQDPEVIISQALCSFDVDCPEKIDPCGNQMKVEIPLPPAEHLSNLNSDNTDTDSSLQMGGQNLLNPPVLDKDLVSETSQKDVADSLQPLKLEIEFDGDRKKKPPPRKLGERLGSQLQRKKSGGTKERTAPSKIKNDKEQKIALEQSKEVGKLEETGPVDPLREPNHEVAWDKLEDLNVNPFGGMSKVCNSPSSVMLPAADSAPHALPDKKENGEPTPNKLEGFQKPDNIPGPSNFSGKTKEFQKQPVKKNTCKVKPMVEVSAIPLFQDSQVFAVGDVLESRPVSNAERISDGLLHMRNVQSSHGMDNHFIAGSSDFIDCIMEGDAEEFRPADQIPAFNEPIEIDYLEQFGHSLFHASALRKQSLYLKFDPLLRESPAKVSVKPLENEPDAAEPTTRISDILDLEPVPGVHPDEGIVDNALVPGLYSILNDPVADFLSAVPAEGAIVEVLKYSQKDLDAAIQVVKREADTKIMAVRQELVRQEALTLEWKQKHKESLAQCAEMKNIVNEYTDMTFQMMEASDKNNQTSKAELEKVNEEKLQALKELNSVELSFSELFKRFEKQKEVLEGYKKNEESLKKCAMDYMARIGKEEQRYQALKAHAEEKLNRASEEIALFRTKYKAEVGALQALQRKEQMKAHSLESSLEDMTKQNAELSKLCDDLISKMEKI
ncbi:transforming acidic coiled-coil-containing protein 3-like [Leucoraja erinacea]|uniref:transforming acidic coiled-coil-containing protein 3-like n=1 Tax=Leucoraja erinaceus TaxID=7782 RepID=UPI002458473B|nr:transforming acidic coiled-coil-containing protein 3-like [Leucoraja erinacea]